MPRVYRPSAPPLCHHRSMAEPEILWQPPADVRERTRIGRYLGWMAGRGRTFADYDELWRWSVDDLEGFWRSVWDFGEVHSNTPVDRVLADPKMPGTVWFSGARLNWAQHALRLASRVDSDTVLIAHSESRARSTLSAQELRDGVARVRTGLQRLGVG